MTGLIHHKRELNFQSLVGQFSVDISCRIFVIMLLIINCITFVFSLTINAEIMRNRIFHRLTDAAVTNLGNVSCPHSATIARLEKWLCFSSADMYQSDYIGFNQTHCFMCSAKGNANFMNVSEMKLTWMQRDGKCFMTTHLYSTSH